MTKGNSGELLLAMFDKLVELAPEMPNYVENIVTDFDGNTITVLREKLQTATIFSNHNSYFQVSAKKCKYTL